MDLDRTPHTVKDYNPDRTPDDRRWLALDEDVRIDLIEQYHHAARIDLPNAKLHSTFHAMIENQIALPHPPVVRAMERLAKQGLSRHDCIHAIGWVLMRYYHKAMTSPTAGAESDFAARYDDAVERLTAAEWLAQAGD